MPKMSNKIKDSNVVFKYFSAFKNAEPWKYFEKSLNFKQELPDHLIKSHFEYLWNTDNDFKNKLLCWVYDSSVELMDFFKKFNETNSVKNKKIYVTEKQFTSKNGRGLQAKVLDTIIGGDEFSTNEITVKIFGKANKINRQRVYMALYHLKDKGIVKKNIKDDLVVWIHSGAVQKNSTRKNIEVKKSYGKHMSQINKQEVNSKILDITSEKPLSISNIFKSLNSDNLLGDSSNTVDAKKKVLYYQLDNLHKTGLIVKTKSVENGIAQVYISHGNGLN